MFGPHLPEIFGYSLGIFASRCFLLPSISRMFFNGDDDGDDHDNEVDDDAEVDDDLMLLLFFVVVDTMMLTMIISILGVKPPFRGHPWLL